MYVCEREVDINHCDNTKPDYMSKSQMKRMTEKAQNWSELAQKDRSGFV
jgi:hypothetical protein